MRNFLASIRGELLKYLKKRISQAVQKVLVMIDKFDDISVLKQVVK